MIPRFLTLILRIPTLIPRIPIIPFIPFPYSSFWFLQIAKNRNISRYQTTNLLKIRFFILVCKKGQKEDKSKFETKSLGIILTIIFM